MVMRSRVCASIDVVNWLNAPEESALETTIGFEQVAIEVTVAIALAEPILYFTLLGLETLTTKLDRASKAEERHLANGREWIGAQALFLGKTAEDAQSAAVQL
jgi:hypothetical protein